MEPFNDRRQRKSLGLFQFVLSATYKPFKSASYVVGSKSANIFKFYVAQFTVQICSDLCASLAKNAGAGTSELALWPAKFTNFYWESAR